MKRVLAFLCIVALVFTLSITPAHAAGSGSLSVSNASGKQGDTVTLTVNLDSNPGLISMKFTVSYPSDLELISVANAGTLNGWTTPNPAISSPYTIRWADSLAAANNTATGALVTLTFQIKDTATPGSKTVNINFAESRDVNGSKNTFNSPAASIQVNCKNHSFGSWTKVDNTNHSRTCTACGYVEKSAHTWDNGKVTEEPSCTKVGKKTYTCTLCAHTKTEDIAKTAHTYGKWTKVDDNNHAKKCSCGDTVTEKHTWDGGKVTTQPTCTKEGVKTYTCTGCSHTKTEAVSKTAHTYGNWTKVDDANHAKKCSCGDTITEKHTWDSGKVTTQPTCAKEGVKTYTCTGCKATKTESIAKTAHTYTNACDTTCNGCGATRTITHNYSQTWSSDKSGHWHGCTVCGNAKDKAAHTESDWIVDKEAQDLSAGSRHTECTVCGYTIKTESIPALGCKHTGETEITDVKDATCTEDGYTGDMVCKICGTVLEEGSEIASSGHQTELKNAKDATCSADGYSGDEICTGCGETVKEGNVLPQTGHSYENGVCTGCGEKEIITTEPQESTAPESSAPAPTTPAEDNTETNSAVLWIIIACIVGAAIIVIIVVILKKKKK